MSNTTKPERILMGVILSPHGIKGDVMVKSFAEVPSDISRYGPLETENGEQNFTLRIVRETHKGLTVHVKGVDDRTAAEALKGTELYIPREKLPTPDTDTYYHADLIGLSAVDSAGHPVGTIKAVQNFGASDILEITGPESKDTIMVPFVDAFVHEVSLETQTVTITVPPSSGDQDDQAE